MPRVCKVNDDWGPVNDEVSLIDMVLYPVKVHVDGIGLLLLNHVIGLVSGLMSVRMEAGQRVHSKAIVRGQLREDQCTKTILCPSTVDGVINKG